MKNYIIWFVGIILWNFTFPVVPPIYDVAATLLLRHIFDFMKFLQQLFQAWANENIMKKYNINGFVIDTNSTEEVKENTLKLNPVIFHTQSIFNINNAVICLYHFYM